MKVEVRAWLDEFNQINDLMEGPPFGVWKRYAPTGGHHYTLTASNDLSQRRPWKFKAGKPRVSATADAW